MSMSSRRICQLAIIIFILYGCRKTDHTISESNESSIEQAFFTKHRAGDYTEEKLTKFIQAQNVRLGFVKQTVKRIGFPFWEHMVYRIINSNTLNGRGTIKIFDIPFARDSQNYVNAVMRISVIGEDTTFGYLQDWQYRQKANQLQDANDDAEKYALFFMQLTKKVFGLSTFRINDPTIFGHGGEVAAKVDLKDAAASTSSYQVQSENFLCQEVTIYYVDCPYQGNPLITECFTGCDRCNLCIRPLFMQFCWIEWSADEGGGGGSGGSGGGGDGGSGSGGGGTGGGGTPGQCEINCDDEDGWSPEMPTQIELCSSIDTYSGATATLQFSLLASHAQGFAPFDLNNPNQNEQYFIVNNINQVSVPGPIQNAPSLGGNITGTTATTTMMVHTHPVGSYPDFSPYDFFDLAKFNNNFQMSFLVAYDGTKYAMVVNSFSKLLNFVNNHPNSLSSSTGGFSPSSQLGSEFFQLMNDLMNQGYTQDQAHEKAMALYMKEAGITLVKAPVGSNVFKKIGIREKLNADGTPQLNASGRPIFENADCP